MQGRVLPSPGRLDPLPGTVHQVEATAADGARVQSWLVLPEERLRGQPAPCCCGSTAGR